MRKTLLIAAIIATVALGGILFASEAQASRGYIGHDAWGLGAGTEEEATGCAGYSGWLNDSYMSIWHRYPRCDEVRFHEAHGTQRNRLEAWLQQVKFDKFRATWGGNTIVAPPAGTTRGSVMWYFDGDGTAHRVYDWPTMMAWGLSMHDYYLMPAEELGFWNKIVPKGEPLQYWFGPYYSDVELVWKNTSTLPQDMPHRLFNELMDNAFTNYGFLQYKEDSLSKCNSWFPDRTVYKYFDWSYANNRNAEVRTDCATWGVCWGECDSP